MGIFDFFKKTHQTYDLQERFFMRLLLLGAIVSGVTILGNLFIKLPFYVNYKWFVVIGLMAMSYRDVRKGHRVFFWHRVVFGMIIFVLIPITWIYTGEFNYLVVAYLFLICIVISFIMEGKQRLFFLGSELVIIFLLIIFDNVFPVAKNYASETAKVIDFIIQIPMTFMAVAYVSITYANAWREEHRQLESYGELLRIKNEELKYLSQVDELTGVYNRRYIFGYLNTVKSEGRTVQIAMIDMDNFKYVNDDFGHLVGDHVICMVCDEIVKSVGNQGVVGRYGGDEFIVVVESKSMSEAHGLLECIQQNLKQSKELSSFPISFSCGLTQLSEVDHIDEALSRADKLLYEVKHNGKDGIAV